MGYTKKSSVACLKSKLSEHCFLLCLLYFVFLLSLALVMKPRAGEPCTRLWGGGEGSSNDGKKLEQTECRTKHAGSNKDSVQGHQDTLEKQLPFLTSGHLTAKVYKIGLSKARHGGLHL